MDLIENLTKKRANLEGAIKYMHIWLYINIYFYNHTCMYFISDGILLSATTLLKILLEIFSIWYLGKNFNFPKCTMHAKTPFIEWRNRDSVFLVNNTKASHSMPANVCISFIIKMLWDMQSVGPEFQLNS